MLETKRLYLKLWEATDAQAVYEIAKDYDVAHLTGWTPHKDLKESQMILTNILMDGNTYKIIRKEDDRIMGSISYNYFEEDDPRNDGHSVELGFYLGKEYWGCGYMPEAANELIRNAFENMDMETIWCCHFDFNTQSRRAQEKLGFHYDHTNYNVTSPITHETYNLVCNRMSKTEWEQFHQSDKENA